MVDALGSGPSGGNTVEVRVLSWAPRFKWKAAFGRFFIVVRAVVVTVGRESFDARTTRRKDEAFFEIPIDTQNLLAKIAV